MTEEVMTPEQALAKLKEDWEVKWDYDGGPLVGWKYRGREQKPATVTSVRITGDFVTLPEEVLFLDSLQSLSLESKKLESLPKGDSDPYYL